MEELKTSRRYRCDFFGCSNYAKYKIKQFKNTKKIIKFCPDCARKMFEDIGVNLVPKAIENQFRNPKKIKGV